MRSKVTWWSLVIFFAVAYGLVGLAGTFAQAFESIFNRPDQLAVLRAGGGWMMAAASGALILSLVISVAGSAFNLYRPIAVGVDLARMQLCVFCGALVAYAAGSAYPAAAALAASFGLAAFLLIDRRINAAERPWQTWALASLAVLVALPPLLLNRL